jgi:hypothetical protein
MPTINSNFIDFKLGDNICFNLKILKTLYNYQESANPLQRLQLRKPIVLLNVSVIEAVLHDLHGRVRTHTAEGVANLSDAVLSYIRGKKIDELEKYIASAKRHDLFDQGDTSFYESLDDLRRLRNRVHIQNTKRHFEPDDHTAFSEGRLLLSEQTLELVMRTMARKFARPKHNFVGDFVLPWRSHFREHSARPPATRRAARLQCGQ